MRVITNPVPSEPKYQFRLSESPMLTTAQALDERGQGSAASNIKRVKSSGTFSEIIVPYARPCLTTLLTVLMAKQCVRQLEFEIDSIWLSHLLHPHTRALWYFVRVESQWV